LATGKQCDQLVPDIDGRRRCHEPDQQVNLAQTSLPGSEPLADLPFDSIASDRQRNMAFRRSQAEAGVTERIWPDLYEYAATTHFASIQQQRRNVLLAEPLDPGIAPAAVVQTASRARPFARRARMTARPPRVRIRTRNPWVRFLFMTEGWYVRFIAIAVSVSREQTARY
jgi:hypothetical protein